MGNHRADRVAESIRHMLPELLRTVKDPRVSGMLTVVRVEVSGDLSLAKIYISAIEGYETARTGVAGLTSAAGMLRREVAARLGLKKSPELKFIADNSIEHSAKIADMLKSMNLPEDKK